MRQIIHKNLMMCHKGSAKHHMCTSYMAVYVTITTVIPSDRVRHIVYGVAFYWGANPNCPFRLFFASENYLSRICCIIGTKFYFCFPFLLQLKICLIFDGNGTKV